MKKTSAEWLAFVKAQFPYFNIIDPDGWDRSNYDYSFNEELITAEEFNSRLASSTILANYEIFAFLRELNQLPVQ